MASDKRAPLPEGYFDGHDDDEEEEDLTPLPDGWREYRSEAHGGLPYYFNMVTKETVWERPMEPAAWPMQDDQDDGPGEAVRATGRLWWSTMMPLSHGRAHSPFSWSPSV